MTYVTKFEPGTKNSRLKRFLGPAASLLNPIHGLILLMLGSLPLMALASQPIGVLLSGLSTYLLFIALQLEESWLELTPLPPLTALCFGSWLHSGLGGLLIALGKPMALEEHNSALWRGLPQAQMLSLALTTTAVLIFAIWRNKVEPPSKANNRDRRISVVRIAIISGIFAMTWMAIGFLFGTLDRNPAQYLFWVAKRWRPDSFFTMFSRFRDLFFLIAPLAIYQAKRTRVKTMLVALFLGYICLALPMGGRGIVLSPFLYAIAGLWLTSISIKRLRIALIMLIVAGLILIPGIQNFRDSSAISKIDRSDFASRVGVLAKSTTKLIGKTDLSALLNKAGLSLYGYSDGYLFQNPAAARARAGTYRMENLWTAWVPELIAPKKVPVRDAHIIAKEIRGASRHEAETMRYTSFDCVTLGGELYWRGGWTSVAAGSCIAAAFYRLASSVWYRHASMASTWQALLLFYPATFLTLYPFGSIGETAWLWTWDLPKYVIMIYMACFTAKKLSQKISIL